MGWEHLMVQDEEVPKHVVNEPLNTGLRHVVPGFPRSFQP